MQEVAEREGGGGTGGTSLRSYIGEAGIREREIYQVEEVGYCSHITGSCEVRS